MDPSDFDISDFAGSVEFDTSALDEMASDMLQQREEVLIKALEEGYDGVDFVQDSEPLAQSEPSLKFTVTERAYKWNDEPPRRKGPHVTRYDFRYWERDWLLEQA